MANPLIQYQISVSMSGIVPVISLTPPQGSFSVATPKFLAGRSLDLTTGGSLLDVGDLATVGGPGLCVVYNPAPANADPKDLTNVITIAPDNTHPALVVVRPSRPPQIFEIATLLSPFTVVTPFAKALLGTPTLYYWIFPAE